MALGVAIEGDRRVELRLAQFPDRLHPRLRREIAAITQELESAVVANEPNRTGRLRSETRSFVDERQDIIRGRVRVLTKGGGASEGGKAAALEYGAHGTSAVKAHARTLTQIYGRLVAPLEVQVEAYSRTLDIAARRFLRGPLADKKSDILARLEKAIGEAAQD